MVRLQPWSVVIIPWIEREDKIAIGGLVQSEGEKVEGGKEGLVKAIEENYKKNVADEFLKPIIVNGDEGMTKGESLAGILMLHQLNVMCISLFRRR